MKPFIQLSASLLRIFAVLTLVAATPLVSGVSGIATEAHAAVVNSISVRGNQRIDADTIRSYVTVKPGKRYTSFDTDESLERLFATGLFADVRITRRTTVLVVEVEENPTINLVLFEGNDKVRDEQLVRIIQSQSLGIYSQAKVDSDIERVREAVRRSGRASSVVTVRIDQLENNRVNVVFLVNEGTRTKITEISFVGNNEFGDRRLMEVISHNESNFLSWLKRDDVYDPARLRADEGLLRTFYFNRGYADFQVISAVGDYDAANNSYQITITIDEGDLYEFGTVEIDNALPQVDATLLQDELKIAPGDTYNARNVEKSLVALTNAIAADGFAFAEVTPRGDRDFDNRTINITFFIDEGPRVYIERIEVIGNDRTRGYVIRREFDVSEGDAYNKVLVNQGKGRLQRLGFFDAVSITTRQGSAPDRVVIIVSVKDKATGEISIGGGYSTNGGLIAEVSLSERNFLGRGQFLKLAAGAGDGTRKYELSFTEPYFLGHRIAAGFDLSYGTQDADDDSGTYYDSETFLGRFRASAPLSDHLRLSVNYTIKNEDISSNIDPNDLSFATLDLISRSPYMTSAVGYSLVYSDVDNYKTPREGFYAKFTQFVAGLGGDAQYIRSSGQVKGFYLVSEDSDIVISAGARAGHIYNYGSDTLRITDHFEQGGETIRGFASRGFGPREVTAGKVGESLGGQTYYNASVEVRFPMLFIPRSYGISGAFFADAGTLYDSDYDGVDDVEVADSNSIRASVGASLIWDSPFGPLRADFAHVLSQESFDETEPFRFGVSSSF